MKSLNEHKDLLTEKNSYNLRDFDFYKSKNSKGATFSFEHKPTGLEADIITVVQGRSKGDSMEQVDYLEFVDEPDENTIDDIESFIDDNLGYIMKNAKEL